MFIKSLLLSITVLSLPCLAQNSATDLKIAHKDMFNSSNGKSLFKLKTIIEAKYPNRFSIEIDNNSKISLTGGEIDSVNLGKRDMVVTDIDNYMKYLKTEELDIVGLPYICNNNKQCKTIINHKNQDYLLNKYKNNGDNIIPIAIWPGEKKYLFSKIKMDDIKSIEGKKLATKNKDSSDRFYRILGGDIMPISSNDSESKIQYTLETSDFAEDTPENVLKNKNKYGYKSFIDINATRNFYVILANKNWLYSLNTEMRNSIIETIRDIGVSNIEIYQQNEAKEIDLIQTQFGIKEYIPNKWEIMDFQQAGKMVQDNYQKSINKGIFDTIKYEISK